MSPIPGQHRSYSCSFSLHTVTTLHKGKKVSSYLGARSSYLMLWHQALSHYCWFPSCLDLWRSPLSSHISHHVYSHFLTYTPSSPLAPIPKQAATQLRFPVIPFMQIPFLSCPGSDNTGARRTHTEIPTPHLWLQHLVTLTGYTYTFPNRSLPHPTIL